MKTCFGYVRVSTLRQGEGVSLEAQKDAILGFAAKNHIEISQWFEETETAAKAGRPVFLNMLRLLRRRKADGVVLHKPDRAARNFADWAKIGDLADSGIDVHFASESLDFRSRGGRLSADIQAVIAADYIRNLKEEIHKGQQGQLQRGIYPFKAPLGYLNSGGGKLKPIDPIKGPIVRRIFELYATGEYSMRSLVPIIEQMGLRTHAGRRVSKISVECMLRNPFYMGVIRIQRTETTHMGGHEPLITASLFESVQKVRCRKFDKKQTRHSHTYRGLFFCELCGTSMIGELQKGHIYYRCHTPGCATKTIREEMLEEAILSVFREVHLTDESIELLTKKVAVWLETRVSDSPSTTYKMQLEQIRLRLDRLTDALLERLIDGETFNTRKQALLIERTAIEHALKADRTEVATPRRIQKFLELIQNLYLNYKNATKLEKRQLVEYATSNRVVDGKKLVIEPAKWLQEAQHAITVLLGGDDRATSRSSHGVTKEQVLLLSKLSKEITRENLNETLEECVA